MSCSLEKWFDRIFVWTDRLHHCSLECVACLDGSRQIKEKEFGFGNRSHFQNGLVAHRGAVASLQRVSIHGHRSFSDLDPRVPSGPNFMGHLFARTKDCGKKVQILMNGQRSLPAIMRGDEPKATTLFFIAKVLLFVTRRQSSPLGRHPDLQEMDRILLRAIVFTVADAGACAHALDVSALQFGAGAHTVPMGK